MTASAAIRALIEKTGAITVADYMQLALQHPEFGYYRHGDPLGQGGDFITAPEISQMFGEMIGLWCADVWRQMGSPAEFVLLELGPGHGTLMQDALRATAKITGFHAALRLHLLESSETLRAKQMEKLGEFKPTHITCLAAEGPTERRDTSNPPPALAEGDRGGLSQCASPRDVPNAAASRKTSTFGPPPTPPASGRGALTANALPNLPTIVIANEFFDALPIRQFEKSFQGWCERLVTSKDNVLSFTLSPPDEAILLLIPEALREANPGTVFEFSPSSLNLMRDLSLHIKQQGGAALVIDYGFAAADGKPTLQAVTQHHYADVLENPGEADITALVDFSLLRRAATMQGLNAFGPLGQREFLLALGIELRADQLKRHATQEQIADINSALHRLTGEGEMGSLFKVLSVASPQLSQLPGF